MLLRLCDKLGIGELWRGRSSRSDRSAPNFAIRRPSAAAFVEHAASCYHFDALFELTIDVLFTCRARVIPHQTTMAVPSAKHTLLMKASLAGTEDGHRASCHRCGNLRKRNVKCSECPHIFCQRCAEKVLVEWGPEELDDGCPVCKLHCCCQDHRGKGRKLDRRSYSADHTPTVPPADTAKCNRMFHCYKKCAAVKNGGGEDSMVSSKRPVMTIEEAAPLVAGQLAA